MKAITKDYLENTLKNYTTSIIKTKQGVEEVEVLPDTLENKVYNLKDTITTVAYEDVTEDTIETISSSDYFKFQEMIQKYCYKTVSTATNSDDDTVYTYTYTPILGATCNNKNVSYFWYDTNSHDWPHIVLEDATTINVVSSDNSTDINFGKYIGTYYEASNNDSFKTILTNLLGYEPDEEDYTIYCIDELYGEWNTAITIKNGTNFGSYTTIGDGVTCGFVFLNSVIKKETTAEEEKVYAKDIQVSTQPVELTSAEYNQLILNGKVLPDTVYYITDESVESELKISQTYSSDDEKAQSCVAIANALTDSSYVKLNTSDTITGAKTFSSIKIGDCTVSNNSGSISFGW